MRGNNPRALHWLLLPLLVLGSCVLGGVASLGAGMFAIQHQWLRGPDISTQLGSYQLIARTTTRPECIAVPQQECMITFPIPFAPPNPRYIVWLGRVESIPAPHAATAIVTSAQGRVIVDVPLAP